MAGCCPIAGSNSWLFNFFPLSPSHTHNTHFCSHHTRKVQELWWKGLPPGVRGEVWKKAIGNELNISPSKAHKKRKVCVRTCITVTAVCAADLYRICLNRCKERLASVQMKTRSGESPLVYYTCMYDKRMCLAVASDTLQPHDG